MAELISIIITVIIAELVCMSIIKNTYNVNIIAYIGIFVTSSLSAYLTSITCEYDIIQLVCITASMVILICSSYTDMIDKKICLVPLIMLVLISAIPTASNIIKMRNITSIFILVFVLAVFVAINMLGTGDLIIFISIGMLYNSTKSMPVVSYVVTLFISSVLSMVYIMIQKIVFKSNEKHYGFTTCITIAFVIQYILNII